MNNRPHREDDNTVYWDLERIPGISLITVLRIILSKL